MHNAQCTTHNTQQHNNNAITTMRTMHNNTTHNNAQHNTQKKLKTELASKVVVYPLVQLAVVVVVVLPTKWPELSPVKFALRAMHCDLETNT